MTLKELKIRIGEIYLTLIHSKDLSGKEYDVLTKLGECLDILNKKKTPAPKPIKAGGLTDMVSVTCYGRKQTYTRKDALQEFAEGMACSEGSEHERYETIFFQLLNGEKNCTDERDFFNRY